MYIYCNALSKLYDDFCNLSLPALGVESLKPCCCCSMKSFERILHVFLFVFLIISFFVKEPAILLRGAASPPPSFRSSFGGRGAFPLRTSVRRRGFSLCRWGLETTATTSRRRRRNAAAASWRRGHYWWTPQETAKQVQKETLNKLILTSVLFPTIGFLY